MARTAAARLRGGRGLAIRRDRAAVVTGDRIAIVLPGASAGASDAGEVQARVLGLVMGALRSGIVPVMVNPALPPEGRDEIIADAEVSLVVDTPELLFALTDDSSGSGGSQTSSTGTIARAAWPSSRVELADIPLGRPMHYTSGTTGRSKGVWSGVLDEATATTLWADEARQWNFEADDVTLVHGPLAHSGPLRFAMLVLLAGGTVLLPGTFNAERIARSLVADRPTHAFVVPSHIQRLLALPGGPPPSPYRLLTHAGAACPESLKRQIHQWAGVDHTWEFYGSTEGQFSACSGEEWEQRPGTVGQARTGRTLEIREGVIWCLTPEWFDFEYWNDPEKTASAWRTTEGGHREFSVGDLGRLDDDGYLWLDGRRDDLIITGGINVYPAQVEAALLGHPGVSEAAVFGVDDDQWGQRVCAAVIADAPTQAIAEYAALHLANYQRPKDIYRVADLPRTASGKTRRTALPEFLGLA